MNKISSTWRYWNRHTDCTHQYFSSVKSGEVSSNLGQRTIRRQFDMHMIFNIYCLIYIIYIFNIYHTWHCYCNTVSFNTVCYESDECFKNSFILWLVPHSSVCHCLGQALLVPCLEYCSNWLSFSVLPLLSNPPLTLWPLWCFWNKSQATLSLSYKPFSGFPLSLR